MKESREVVFSVTALNNYVRKSLRDDPLLSNIRLRGEIGSFRPHYSGHWYFTLKDEECEISAVMWRQNQYGLKLKPENGMRVVVLGSIDLYPPNGKYQINVTAIRPDGVGSLYQQFELIKSRLMAEGLFDESRKRMLPLRPGRIAAVTAESGAVIHDIINVSRRRDPGIPIVLVPVPVQGDVGEEIARGVRLAGTLPGVDVIIVGRGGGSMEDLWCFNSEALARAIAESPVPVISAVGHETDFTIADFAADVRASTPSHAAEIAVPDRSEVRAALREMRLRLDRDVEQMLMTRELQLSRLKHRLEAVGPGERLNRQEAAVKLLAARLEAALDRQLAEKPHQLEGLEKRLEQAVESSLQRREKKTEQLVLRLEAVNPANVLNRGYAWVTGAKGLVPNAQRALREDRMTVHFRDGAVEVTPLPTGTPGADPQRP